MGELEIFSIRLKQLREKMGLSQKDFSEFIGVKQQTLSGYERNVMKPPLDVARNIAEKCKVSIDWLCGLSDNMTGQITLADILKSPSAFETLKNNYNDLQRISYRFNMESKQMRELLANGTIDDELYNQWEQKTLEKYQYPISNLFELEIQGTLESH